MAYTVWSMVTWIFLPLGGIIALLFLSGFETLEKFGRRLCRLEFQVGAANFSLPFLISLVCSLCFGGEWFALSRLRSQRNKATLEPLEFNDSWRALLWRHQRNWWLSLSSLILWLVIWRIDVLVQAFRDQLRSIETQKIAVLRQQAQNEDFAKSALEAQISEGLKPTTPKSTGEKKRD